MRILFFTICIFFPAVSWALEENSTRPNFAFGSMLASLLLVIACIFVFAYLMKKTNLLKNGRGKSLIKVVATQPLTNKGRVQVIELNGLHYLLGVTEQNITLLDKFDKPLQADPSSENEAQNTPFATLLSKTQLSKTLLSKMSNKSHE